VELKDGGNTPGVHNDFVHVTGAASIANGVAIHVTPENGTDNGSTYAANTRYTLLTADGGLTVSGSQTITDDYAYLNFTSGFDTNHYYLTSTLAATSFCLPGQTKNQCTTGNGAFALGPGNPVYAALLNLNAAASGPALDQLSGLPYTFGNLLAFRAITGFHGLLNQRIGSDTSMQTAFEQLSNLRLAYNGDDLSGFVSPPEKDGFWIRALANDGRVNGDGNAAGADTSGGGVALGADRWLTPDLKAGVAFAYSRDRADVDNGLGSLALDSYQLAAYARWQNIAGTPGRYLNASIGYGIHKGEGNRDMALIGQRANGNYDADSYTASIEAGQNFASGQATLTPYVGLAAARVVRGDFSESGGAAALRIAGRTDNSLRSSVGLRAAWWTESLAPTVDMAWVHEYDDSQGGIDAGFAVAPATTRFGIVGPKLERDRLALKLGLTAWKDKTSRLDVGYNGEFASSDRNHMAAATFRWVW
jgi:outer membrane autotransporter protein